MSLGCSTSGCSIIKEKEHDCKLLSTLTKLFPSQKARINLQSYQAWTIKHSYDPRNYCRCSSRHLQSLIRSWAAHRCDNAIWVVAKEKKIQYRRDWTACVTPTRVKAQIKWCLSWLLNNLVVQAAVHILPTRMQPSPRKTAVPTVFHSSSVYPWFISLVSTLRTFCCWEE